MKKIIFLLASLVAIFTAIANNYMHVYLNNGSILDFDTDSILQVDVLKDSVTNSNYLLVVKNDSSALRIDKSDIQKITYDDTTFKVEPVTEHEYVDLGLPSGTLWATCNVGATKPTEYGDYFAWGETEPKEVYADSTYKWFYADSEIYTKYNSEDGLTTLLPEDDAATANWGSEWRMPTNEEQRELYENSYMVQTDGYNGTDVIGVIFYKAKSAEDKGEFVARWQTPSSDYSVSSDAHVFLPAAGYRWDWFLNFDDDYSYYWSSSLSEYNERNAHYLEFGNKGVFWGTNNRSRRGFPVRAVANKTTDIEEYVVSFYTQDSVLIESQKVEKGKSATAVDAPVVDGYEFIGWSDSSFTNVMKDQDIYAQYKAITKDTLPVSGQIAEHDYVDLGLPSGTLWATYNVGATTPEEYGDYFAWGETKPKEDYSWSTYKWCENKKVDAIHIPQDFTKYVVSSEYGIVDNKIVLEAEDDAATANWGADWRMPTFDEINELTENCEYSWIEVNGIKGAKFTASNGNFVFFPAAGNRYGSEIECSGQKGYYRSSSLHESYDHCAERIYFNEKGFYKKTIPRDEGHSVRAVANIK